MAKENKHLHYLEELSDYKVASDDPDVRGWELRGSDDRKIGKVTNLLVNKARKRVVYLEIEVDKAIIDADHTPYGEPAASGTHEFINKEGENHLIVPIGLARLNEDEKYVYTDTIDFKTFAETKRIEKGLVLNRDYETIVLSSYQRRRRNPETKSSGKNSEKPIHREKSKDEYANKGKQIPTEDHFYNRDEFDESNFRGDQNA